MRTTKIPRLSIELFDVNLLKETRILANEEGNDALTDLDYEADDFFEEINGISLLEFQKTLN